MEYTLKDIISYAKSQGFVYPSSEIYDGVSALYDYGPQGVLLKNNLKKYWWDVMTRLHENVVGIDSAILMHPTVWKASGHQDAFNDPLIDNKDSKKRYRADVLVEDHIEKLEAKIEKEVTKVRKKYGEDFNRERFETQNSRVAKYIQEKEEVLDQLSQFLAASDLQALKSLIDRLGIVCLVSGTKNWTEVRQFNLMFETQLGSVAGDASKTYLRPETAQGIFVNFLNAQKSNRLSLPFGIAQIGKAFRNEIVARQFTFRMKEFEQMEMQFFVKPGDESRWFEYWKAQRMQWHATLGLPSQDYKFHDHQNLAHYASAATDIEFKFPFGFKELEGVHSRTDFDLKAHERYAKKKISYFDAQSKISYTPYVIETSLGLDRLFLALLSGSLKRQTLPDGSIRECLAIHPGLAPYQVAVFPLIKKPELIEKARQIYHKLRWEVSTFYDEKDSIGKRYRRADLIGTPLCITIDFDTEDSVTVRHRDSMQQEQVLIQNLLSYTLKHTRLIPPQV